MPHDMRARPRLRMGVLACAEKSREVVLWHPLGSGFFDTAQVMVLLVWTLPMLVVQLWGTVMHHPPPGHDPQCLPLEVYLPLEQ